jgi:hypothetical protein
MSVPSQAGAGGSAAGSDKRQPNDSGAGAQAAAFDSTAFSAAIGDRKTAYYLRHFERFHRGESLVSWHWPACFLTIFWLLYRRQWSYALVYFAVPIAVQILIGLSAAFAPSVAGILWLAWLLALFIVPGLFANALYYRHCRTLVTDAQNRTRSRDEQIGVLEGKGGTSNVALLVGAVLPIVAIIGILAAVALPAYQDYTIRAKAEEAVAVGRQASGSVDLHYKSHERYPASLEEAGFAAALPPNVTGMSVDPGSGAVTVELRLSESMRGHIVLAPTAQPDKSISWKCRSPDLKPALVPLSCREPGD